MSNVYANVYAEDALRAMQTRDDGHATSVFVVHYPEHVRMAMPDNCPGEAAEEVFEELAWELAMLELATYRGGAR